MKKIIRLTESDLARIVRRVISEQHSTLPDGVYYGAGSGSVYELFYDETCEKTTGYKVIKAPRKFRGWATASETNVIGGVPNSEYWGSGGEIIPVISEQHSTLPDGVYYGDGSGSVYELFYDENGEKTTGYKVINAPRTIRGGVTASKTNVIGGVPNSEDWGSGGEIIPTE